MTYTYECTTCKNEFEIEQSIKATPMTTCPSCSNDTLKRLITNGNFVLKGDCWAKDLYSSKK